MSSEGKIVWVTGAGSGIGRATAIAFANEGAKVALTGRTVSALEETAALMPAGSSMIAKADVTDAAQVTAAHQAIVAAWGDPHILVNNAGFNLANRYWSNLTPEGVASVINANLYGPFICSLAVLPAMRKAKSGLIIHIASFAGQAISFVSGASYTAAKTGAVAMSATLNAEYGIHGVRSVCISPGEVATPILDRRPRPPTPEERAKMLQPEDVAACATFAANLPPRACPMEIVLVPTDNASYRAGAQKIAERT